MLDLKQLLKKKSIKLINKKLFNSNKRGERKNKRLKIKVKFNFKVQQS